MAWQQQVLEATAACKPPIEHRLPPPGQCQKHTSTPAHTAHGDASCMLWHQPCSGCGSALQHMSCPVHAPCTMHHAHTLVMEATATGPSSMVHCSAALSEAACGATPAVRYAVLATYCSESSSARSMRELLSRCTSEGGTTAIMRVLPMDSCGRRGGRRLGLGLSTSVKLGFGVVEVQSAQGPQ